LSHETSTSQIYTLSLHDALPISAGAAPGELAQAGLGQQALQVAVGEAPYIGADDERLQGPGADDCPRAGNRAADEALDRPSDLRDRKSTRLNSSHDQISYAVFCF